jgi:plasmid stabilization system protein ParE
MAGRKIVWTETAAKQRREILKYWTERNQSSGYALSLIELIAKHLKVISKNPKHSKKLKWSIFENLQWDISVCIIPLMMTN